MLLRQSRNDKVKQYRMGGMPPALMGEQDQQHPETAACHLLNKRLQGLFARTKKGRTMA